jgi:hypothetical protein
MGYFNADFLYSDFMLNWSSLKHTATTEIDIAETTRTFWEGNNIQKLAVRKYNTKKQISNHVNTIIPLEFEISDYGINDDYINR